MLNVALQTLFTVKHFYSPIKSSKDKTRYLRTNPLSRRPVPATLRKKNEMGSFILPVRYCPKGDVQVQSGDPSLRENKHSRCNVDPGNTANSPAGSTLADPEGILIKMVGGASSGIMNIQTGFVRCYGLVS